MGAMGVAELPAYTITAPIAARMKRRPLVASCLLVTTVLLISLSLLKYLRLDNGELVCNIFNILFDEILVDKILLD